MKQIISTLGPTGTCSEYASNYYTKLKGIDAEVKLLDSFEHAIEELKCGHANLTIIPSAYAKLAEIIFRNHDKIRLIDVFQLDTPILMLAKIDSPLIRRIAVHASPVYMVKQFYPEAEFHQALSNADAAQLLLKGIVDACVTTNICVNKYNLKVVQDFGEISMGWNVFINTASQNKILSVLKKG
jgi:prephenate dehydratase